MPLLFANIYSQLVFISAADAKMLIRQFRHYSSLRCSVEKTLLDKIRLIYIFYGNSFFTYRCCDSIYTYRSTLESFDDSPEYLSIQILKPHRIHTQRFKGLLCDIYVYAAVTLDL